VGVKRLPWVVVGAFVALGCAGGPKSRSSASWHEIPAEWQGDFVFVEVEINGTRERLLLDTGSDLTVLSPELVARVGVPTFDQTTSVSNHGGEGEAKPHRFADVRLQTGGLAEDVTIVELPLDKLGRALGEPPHGILGLDMWAGASLQIDYPNRTVRWSDDPLPAPDGKTVFPTTEGQRMQVRLPDGRGVTVIVDSGANRSALPEALEGELPFKVRPRLTSYAETFDGTTAPRTGRLDGPVRIGRYEVKDPIVDMDADGVMGTDWLRHFVVTLDVARSRIALDRKGPAVIDVPPFRGVGATFAKEPDRWVVLYVVPGGPAERAGLRKGDRVLSLEGAEGNLRLDRRQDLIETRSVVSLDVERAGSSVRLEIPVEVLVE